MSNNSMTYEGDWQDGIIQGNGKIRWSTGNFYEGEFRNSKINGNGYLIWYDNNEKYTGQWTDSLQNGLGIHIWYEAKGEQKYLRNRYVGEWRNGFRHGYGVFFYSNGAKYEGTWDQNYKHGFGVFTFYDGSQYIGKFHNDRMIDFNANSLYAPTNLNKVQENHRISTAQSQSNKNKQRGTNTTTVQIKEENENLTTNTGFNKMNSSLSLINEVGSKDNANKDNNKFSKFKGLEEIPENNESMNAGMSNPVTLSNNLAKENKNIRTNEHSSSVVITNDNFGKPRETIVATKTLQAKEAELNQFKTSIDINDIIECETDLEQSLREVENILLRHLTEMKEWYNRYIAKGSKDSNKDEFNTTNNSMMPFNENSRQSGYVGIKEDKNEEKDTKREHNSMTNLGDKFQSIADGVYNNDLGFCMEMKDMWKFMRESNIISSEFTLSQFNRIFFKGPKNYIEMFLLPDDLEQKNTYEYIYIMINKAKDDFYQKYKYNFEKLKQELNANLRESLGSNSNSNSNSMNNSNANINFKSESSKELEVNFDFHNKHQIILLRQFYEAIVRIAYMKYFHLSQPLSQKLRTLIENCIRYNPFFLKKQNNKRSFNKSTDSSMNMSVLDLKVKSYEISLENYLKEYEYYLKPLFKSIYYKSSPNPKKYDMTITYRYFYETLVLKSENLKGFLEDKLNFIGLINIYHKDKITITEENRNSKDIFAYAENLLDCEFIFYEFCEMMFYISRKYFIKANLTDKKEFYIDMINHLQDLINKVRGVNEYSERSEYHYPVLQYHLNYNAILDAKRQREEEEKRRQQELMRVDKERKYMMIEDINVIPEHVENDEEQSSYSEDFDH